jgi:LPS-assembly protein
VPPASFEPPPPLAEQLNFTAGKAETLGENHYRLSGGVAGRFGDQQLEAEHMDYDGASDTASLEGRVRYLRGGRLLTGERAELSLAQDTGRLDAASFWLLDKHARGRADTVHLDGPTTSRMEGVFYTTCEEGSEHWSLKAAELRLDTAKNEGVARHARVEFMHVPVFYFPYLSFPLEGRKTGFLVPEVGESQASGTELSLPYYWNLAPHRDATFTPHFMSRRGILWQGEFRYLNPTNGGEISVAALPGDEVYGENRRALDIVHRGDPAPRWRTSVAYHYTSDPDYLHDFGGQLSSSSLTNLERRADLSYRAVAWQAELLFQEFQTLDPNLPALDRPYKRLPQLNLLTDAWRGPSGMQLDLRAEAVHFVRDEGVAGSRLDVEPRLRWPLRGRAGFIVPSLSLRDTRYNLDRNIGDDQPARRLPLFSLDSGLVFEREIHDSRRARAQTLEPRLFYLYVPYRDQAGMITDTAGTDSVFDTTEPVFGFDQLFRENRFNGADRVGDANQLSAALTSRFLDERGRDLGSVALGRTVYFHDRRVTLPGESVATDDASHWLAEVISHWTPPFTARATIAWDDTEARGWQRGTVDLRYRRDTRRVVNLGYRYERGLAEQFDVSALWPVGPRWSVVGRWLHSVRDDLTLESLKGVEYNDCCWAFRVVQRRYRVDARDEKEADTLWLQLELKGLTSVGRRVENLLERDILAP